MRALALVVAALLPASAGAAALDEASLNALFDGSAVRALPHAAPAARAASPASPAPLSKEDREEIAAVLEGARRASAAWPGYDLLAEPLLIVRPGGRSFLIAHPNPPADFAPQTVAGRVVYVSDTPRDPGFPYRFDYPVGGVPATVLTVGGTGPSEDAALIAHEGFHRYQNRWTERAWGPYKVEDADDMAAAELEQRALARALEDGAGWRVPAEEFLALRRLRRQRHPEIADGEDSTERDEGTALFIEGSAVPSSVAAAALPDQLRRPLSLENMSRDRFYLTGAALARLLERAGPGWRARVESGAALYELLEQAVPLPEADAERMAAAAVASAAYASLKADAATEVAAFQAKRAAALARFEAQPGVRLAVTGRAGFSTSKWYRLPQGGSLLDPAELVSMDQDGWRLRVENRAVFMTEEGANVVVVDPALLMVDGARWAPAAGSRPFRTMTLSMPGVELRLQGGTLSFDGKTLTIRR